MLHHGPVPDVVDGPRLARARWVLMGLFGLQGVMFSSWLARLPSVRDALDMSPSELGGVLLVGAVGALVAVTVAGAVVARWGGRSALVLSSVGFSAAYVLLGLGPALGLVPVLAAGVFLNGVAFAIGNVPLNVESAGVERRLGRTVLPHFHAAFSVGAVVGSLLGAAMAALRVDLLGQFVGTAVVVLVWRLASIPHVVLDCLPAHELAARAASRAAGDPSGEPTPPSVRGGGLRTALGAWRERRTVLIGVVIMSAALSEGSANDWLALAVVDGFAQREAVGAVVFGVFVGAMTVVRMLGTRLIDRYGRVAVLRVSGVVSLVGLLVFGLAPTLPVAAAGVVAWGLGAALAVPIGLAAASDDPLRAAGRVSVVSAFSSMAHLAAPPLLGLAAEHIGARHALLLITGAMVASVLLAGQVAHPGVPARTPPAARRDGGRPADDAAASTHQPTDQPVGAVAVGVGETEALPVGEVLTRPAPSARPGPSVPTQHGAPPVPPGRRGARAGAGRLRRPSVPRRHRDARSSSSVPR